MTAIANLPDLRPSLLMDFANSGRVDPRIQSTRSSSATCYGPDGKLRTVAANVPRIDYDPVTGKCLGLLVEEPRTNLFTYSADLTNPVWSKAVGVALDGAQQTVGGLLLTKVNEIADSTGSKNVRRMFPATYAAGSSLSFKWFFTEGTRRFCLVLINGAAGVASCAFDLKTGELQVKATSASGWIWTAIKHSTGVIEITATCASLPGQYDTSAYIDVRLSPAASLGDVGPTGDTYTGGAGRHIYVGPIQLEVGAFPTSYIQTGASATTRTADFISLTIATLGEAINAGEGTFLAKYLLGAKSSSVGIIYAYASSSPSGNNTAMRYASGKQAQYTVNVDGVGQVSLAPSGFSSPGYYKRAISFQPNNFNQAINGQLPSPKVTTGAPGSSLTNLSLGSEVANNQLCGHIQEFAVYGRALTDPQLQRITA